MLNGLKKFASAVVAVIIAFTFVGAFSHLSGNVVNADEAVSPALSALKITGKVRMQTYGNKTGTYANEVLTLGKKGKKKRIETLTLSFKNNTEYEGSIKYRVYVQKKGWTGWKTSGQKVGTKGKRIEGVRIELTGELAKHYSVVYSAYTQTVKGKQSWVSDGATAGTPNEGRRIEQIQVKIIPRERFSEQPTVVYRMYRDKYKWAKRWYRNGEVAGVTSGSRQKHEGLQMTILGSHYTGNIEYRARGAGYSWMGWTTKNSNTGKPGTGKRMEEIQIRLTGEIAEHFDVYYRTCVKSKGWLGWAKNGEKSGTEKYDYYIMALQCVIVPKDSGEPGNVKNVKSKYTSSYLINGNPTLKFADFKADYKKSNTMLGIDVSKYQGNIDFKKVKAAGCDFVILRCYVRNNYYDSSKKKYVWCNAPDTKFETYYKAAKAAGLKIGVYFFTCDYTEANMRKYTQDMIAKCKLKDKQIDFPIAFDWENFDYYKRAHASNKWSTSTMNKHIDSDLNKMVAVFEEEVEKAGFSASIYGSKSRLEGTWAPSIKNMNQGKNNLSIWMAHWVSKSSYKGDYYMWQVNSHGRVPGISGDVDLDVAYIDRLPSPVSPVKPEEEPVNTQEPEGTKNPEENSIAPETGTKPEESNAATEGGNGSEPGAPEEGNATPDDNAKAPAESGKSAGESNEPEDAGKQAEPAKEPAGSEEADTSGKKESSAESVPEEGETSAKEPVASKETGKTDAVPAGDASAVKETEPKKTEEPVRETAASKETVSVKPVTPSKEQPEEAKTSEP